MYHIERNNAIKVFSQLFVAVTRPGDSPLAFATPHEANAAGRKRQETALTWVQGKRNALVINGQYQYDERGRIVLEPDESFTRIVENVPRSGFRVTDDIKRVYWGGGNVVWRVRDPDGWEIEIQSANLMAIIQSAGIERGGEIPGKCVWGREGGINVLLHETSDEYKDSIKAAETLKPPKQVAKGSRNVGGIYRMVDGSLAVYLGKVHVTKTEYPNEANEGNVKLVFPHINGASTTSKKHGFGNWARYHLEDSTPFEAVVTLDGEVLSKFITLYKKASLVEQIGTYELPEITNSLLDSFKWQFASAAMSCARIMSVTVEPITDPVVKLLPWTDKQYEEALEKIKYREKGFENNGIYFGAWFKERYNAVVVNDTLCGGLGVAGQINRHKPTPVLPYAVPLITTGDVLTIMAGTDDISRVYTEDPYGMYSAVRYNRGTSWNQDVNVIPIHGLSSYQDYLAWFEKIRTDRALFNIVVRNHK